MILFVFLLVIIAFAQTGIRIIDLLIKASRVFCFFLLSFQLSEYVIQVSSRLEVRRVTILLRMKKHFANFLKTQIIEVITIFIDLKLNHLVNFARWRHVHLLFFLNIQIDFVVDLLFCKINYFDCLLLFVFDRLWLSLDSTLIRTIRMNRIKG